MGKLAVIITLVCLLGFVSIALAEKEQFVVFEDIDLWQDVYSTSGKINSLKNALSIQALSLTSLYWDVQRVRVPRVSLTQAGYSALTISRYRESELISTTNWYLNELLRRTDFEQRESLSEYRYSNTLIKY